MALLLALGASLSWGAGDFLGGLASRRASVLAVLPLTQGAGLVGVAVVLAIAQDPVPGLGPAAVAAAAGLAGAVGLAGLYRGMAIGAMGVVAPISALAAVVPFTVGVAGGERPNVLQLVGVVAALIGVVLVSREPGSGSGTARAAGVGLAFVAAVGFGLYFTLTDVAADDAGAPWTVFVSRGAATVIAIVAFLIVRPPLRLDRPLVRLVLVVGLFDVVANVLFSVATTKGLVSIVSVLASLYPVTTVVLARVVLHERISAPQRVGAAAALAGAALITAG